MNTKTTAMAAAAFAALAAFAQPDIDEEAMRKAKEILAKMTLEEKVSLCGGSGTMSMPAIPRVGIDREWQFSDNSHTVRADMERWTWNCTSSNDEATVLPTLSALASTWSVPLAERFGHVMGEQARSRGKDMMLGPGVNIMRTPLCGRNWEYLSEDPVLAAKLAVAEIRALQSHGVSACVKHYCANSQEKDRHKNDAVMDDRTLNEIYLPAFRAAVKEAGVDAIMTSYNLYNGDRCSENDYLLKGILRERWGFAGWIVTDWGGQASTVKGALSGAGTEMNRGTEIRYFVNPKKKEYPLADAVREGKVPVQFIDEKALRVLYIMAKTRFLDPENRKDPKAERLVKRHFDTAREIAEEAIVLLKNDAKALPLDAAKTKNILVVGKLADTEVTRKGWSAEGKPLYEITPLKGLREYFKGKNAAIDFAPLVAGANDAILAAVNESAIGTFDTTATDAGMSVRAWKTTWFDKAKSFKNAKPFKTGFSKQPEFDSGTGAPLKGMDKRQFAILWETELIAPESGEYALGCTADRFGWAAVEVEGKRIAAGRARQVGFATFEAGKRYKVAVRYVSGMRGHSCKFGWTTPSERGSIDDLKKKAEAADAILVFTGTEIGHGRAQECEGADRPDMKLPKGHDEAIAKILSWNLPNTVVINRSGSPMELPWESECKTLVHHSYLGQEAGRALARVLFGDVNPSGRLPCSWPRKYADTAVARVGTVTDLHSIYNERFYVGYRWFDREKTAPMFPFGYGIGYTTFEIGRISAEKNGEAWTLKVAVKNTGGKAGREVVQIYASYPDTGVERCEKELKAFAKTRLLRPGESETLEMPVSERDLAYWDDISNRFTTPAGEYTFAAAASAADIRSRTAAKVEKTKEWRD